MAYFTVPSHRVFLGCEQNLTYLRLPKKSLLRQFAKAAFDAHTDVRLSRERAEAAKMLAELVLEVVAADLLSSPPNVMALYHCLRPSVLAWLGSHWPDVKFAGTHSMRPRQC